MHQIGTVDSEAVREAETEPDERIACYAAYLESSGHLRLGGGGSDVRQDIGCRLERSQTFQETADVNFVAGEMTADSVSVNGDPHAVIPV
jgi:hypothetical protein